MIPVGREIARLEAVGLGKGVEDESVDGLTGTVGEDQSFPVWESGEKDGLASSQKLDEWLVKMEAKLPAPLKVKKMKNANSSFFLVELLIWQKKQKLSYEPVWRSGTLTRQVLSGRLLT